MERIFDPYFTTKGMARDEERSRLTACYAIMRRHGGCITVESTMGKGSVFHLYFPVCHEYTAVWGPSGTLAAGREEGRERF
jgi:signal transduction histidine kinase